MLENIAILSNSALHWEQEIRADVACKVVVPCIACIHLPRETERRDSTCSSPGHAGHILICVYDGR